MSSNNANLVRAAWDSTTGVITLTAGTGATGKATITLETTDGSKKKATCAVTVVNPVSKVNISSKTITKTGFTDYDMAVVTGKSLQLRATLETEYGAISNKGVTWSIDAPSDSGVSISSSGKVTAKKNKSVYSIFTVTATAKDGSGASDTYKVEVVKPTTYITVPYLSTDRTNVMELHEDGMYRKLIYTDIKGGYITATSSNSKVLEVAVSNGCLYFKTCKPGAATVTLAATDGSGKKVKYKFRVLSEADYEEYIKKYG